MEDTEKMLPLVDWLVVTCPLTADTNGLIGEEQLAMMTPTGELL